MAIQRRLGGGGVLTVEEGSGGVRLQVTRPMDGRGLYKVWIYGGGGRMLLGTLAPQGESLGLSRTLSRSTLRSAGCYPVAGGEVVMAFPFHQEKKREDLPTGWRWVEEMDVFSWDKPLHESVQGKKFLRKDGEGGFFLAYPFDGGKEFPIPTLFCFCRWERLGERDYLVWNFDERGRPILGDNS